MADEPVAVVGTLAFDTLVQVPRLPEPDEAVRVDSLHRAFGGPVGNVARRLAALGVDVEARSAVGPDLAASGYEALLAGDGVDLARLVRTDTPTASVFIATDAHGRQAIYYDRGASAHMDRVEAAPADLALFAPGELSSYPRLMEPCGTVLFDPGPETFHWPADVLRDCLARSDVVFVNEHERARIERTVGTVEEILALGPETVVVTEGAAGCTVHHPDRASSVPAVEVDVVDPTGAGDAHRAGVIAALRWGWDLDAASALGNVSASFAVGSVGAQTDLPDRAALLARYEGSFGAAPPVP